jgi:hypothetical protein
VPHLRDDRRGWLPLWTAHDRGFALDGHAPWIWPTIGVVSLCAGLSMFVYVRHDAKDFIASVDEG